MTIYIIMLTDQRGRKMVEISHRRKRAMIKRKKLNEGNDELDGNVDEKTDNK